MSSLCTSAQKLVPIINLNMKHQRANLASLIKQKYDLQEIKVPEKPIFEESFVVADKVDSVKAVQDKIELLNVI